ncbi:hypothetical protein ACFSTC_26925 [Nonomuraea ferruginea]
MADAGFDEQMQLGGQSAAGSSERLPVLRLLRIDRPTVVPFCGLRPRVDGRSRHKNAVDHLPLIAPGTTRPSVTGSNGSIRDHALSVSSPRRTTISEAFPCAQQEVKP